MKMSKGQPSADLWPKTGQRSGFAVFACPEAQPIFGYWQGEQRSSRANSQLNPWFDTRRWCYSPRWFDTPFGLLTMIGSVPFAPSSWPTPAYRGVVPRWRLRRIEGSLFGRPNGLARRDAKMSKGETSAALWPKAGQRSGFAVFACLQANQRRRTCAGL
jgi:hypothetical protein